MKKFLAMLLFSCALVACESKTEYGKCVGMGEDELKDPNLRYKISTRNLIVGLVFIELLAPPVIVVLDKFECPVARK